jgi:hypothetical protein
MMMGFLSSYLISTLIGELALFFLILIVFLVKKSLATLFVVKSLATGNTAWRAGPVRRSPVAQAGSSGKRRSQGRTRRKIIYIHSCLILVINK